MSNRRSPVRAAGLVVVLTAALLTVAPPIAAQDQPPPAPFPASLVASMTAPDQPELAVRSVYLEPGETKKSYPNVVVRFAAPFELPANGYRLSVAFGDPTESSVRTSMRTVDGVPVGSLDAGTGGAYAEIGPIDAWMSPDGTARMVLPPDDLPDRGSMWVTVETADPAASYTSQLYPLEQFLGESAAGRLSASVDAWMAPDGAAAPVVVDVPDPPIVTTDGDVVRLTWNDPPPTQVAGAPIGTFIDVVRIAPDFTTGGQAPYLVAVDHISQTVNLLDGTQLIPATLTTESDDWLVTPLDGEVSDGTYIEFDLSEVARQFDIEVSTDTSAIGAARSITLTDGTVIRADGVIGTLLWFEAAQEAPVEVAGAAPAGSGGDDGVPWLVAAAVGVVVAGALVVALWVRRSRRSRREGEAAEVNEHLLDSAGPLTLGRRLEPGEAAAPRPTVDLRNRPTGKPSHLDALFDPTAQDVAPEQPTDVPDLSLFEEGGIRPVDRSADRPLPPRRRPATEADDLTKALFDAD